MKRLRIAPFFLLIVFAFSFGASAQQIPCPMPPCPPGAMCIQSCPPVGEPLKIDYHRVDVQIENQIAHTSIDMKFENVGNTMAEGSWVFPLPAGAAVDSLTMYVNDTPVEAQILDAQTARQVYEQIVRQYRDPALLQYVGTGAVQANVFPIPPAKPAASRCPTPSRWKWITG